MFGLSSGYRLLFGTDVLPHAGMAYEPAFSYQDLRGPTSTRVENFSTGVENLTSAQTLNMTRDEHEAYAEPK